jgi:hypothetical protein
VEFSPQDEVLRSILAPLARVEPVTLREPRRRRRRRTALVLAGAVVAIILAGAAIASGVGPFPGISAANHSARPSDALGPAVIDQLRTDEPPGGDQLDQVGSRRIGGARLVGTLPSGRRVYLVPTSKGKLCVVVARLAESCGDTLTREAPITFTIVDQGQGVPAVGYGVALDGVVSVSFEAGGRAVTVPVRDNLFVYEAPSGTSFSPPSVTFADGTTESVR